MDVPLYNYSNLLQLFTFQGSLTYDVKRRLTSAISYINGSRDRQYDFIYDGNNNLIRINISALSSFNPPALIIYITFSYPTGTVASLSSTTQVQLNLLSLNNFQWVAVPVYTYNFNTEYQLVSIFQGNLHVEQLTYDVGGNCLTDSVYDHEQNLFEYFVYSGYDNKINPARSDRSLQLFFQMYNKNNPTNSTEYLRGLGPDPNGFGLFRTSSGNYTYNANGYPITYGGNFFADYNCLPPPVSAPGPGSN